MSKQMKVARSKTLRTAIAAGVSIFLATGCASEKSNEAVEPSAKQVEQEKATQEPTSPPSDTMQEDQSYDPTILTIMAIDVDTELAILCGLEESDVFFRFDSAKLLPSAKERLEKLATCAKSGPAQGRELLVVGRTDPVGPDEYNEQLGMSRAESVATYLRELDVKQTRIETESKGEAAAPEDRPGTWPYHRRVTIKLQQ